MNGEAYAQRLVEARGGDPAADLRSAGQQLEARLKALLHAAKARRQAGRQVGSRVIRYADEHAGSDFQQLKRFAADPSSQLKSH